MISSCKNLFLQWCWTLWIMPNLGIIFIINSYIVWIILFINLVHQLYLWLTFISLIFKLTLITFLLLSNFISGCKPWNYSRCILFLCFIMDQTWRCKSPIRSLNKLIQMGDIHLFNCGIAFSNFVNSFCSKSVYFVRKVEFSFCLWNLLLFDVHFELLILLESCLSVWIIKNLFHIIKVYVFSRIIMFKFDWFVEIFNSLYLTIWLTFLNIFSITYWFSSNWGKYMSFLFLIILITFSSFLLYTY